MSGQWEVVKGKNERRSKVPVPKIAVKQSENKSKKPNILNGVKIEEVLSKTQVQNLYSGNKENKLQEKTTKANDVKKPEKKANKAPSEPQKPKPPKSIEAALLAINPDEFSLIYERSKIAFSDAPIVWLKELTQFLNQKIPLEIQDPVFSSKPFGYPLNVVPSNIKVTIETAVREAGKGNAQLYFDIALTSLVTDLSKGLPAVGYRFFLQYIALNEPKLVIENLGKHISLRNSYQNRANVALSVLWAVGHVSVNDLQSGLKVFEDLMLPLLDMKSYSKYIVKYLIELTSQEHESPLTRDQYLLILDTTFSSKKNFPSELQKDLIGNLPKLKSLLFSNKEKFNNSVELFLKKIAATTNIQYQNCLCDILVEIFTKDQSTLTSWNKVYSKNLLASALLLRFISKTDIKSNLRKSLKDLMLNFSTTNEELLLKRRKGDGLREAIAAIKAAQEQEQAPSKNTGVFRKLLSSLIFVLFIAILTEPFYRLNKPRDDLYLFRFGSKIGQAGIWLDSKLDESVPKPYYTQTKEVVQPYGALAGDLLKVAINVHDHARSAVSGFVDEKYPLVVASVST
ncbi:unnamed protein product [Ceutorhynchus assimilis]|uniref:Transmembrane protein 214 n=1 Tax=Ceutorhynchus assimilis TaxID=467358 RepID=A0A9N9MRF4_9CUCU|nr:unnamed protein product [Ceutorhynchus assimilis]